jgi:hypothetical protein
MKAATRNNRTNVTQLDNGEWLLKLLSDIQVELAGEPSELAVQRMRARLVAGLYATEKAAA